MNYPIIVKGKNRLFFSEWFAFLGLT